MPFGLAVRYSVWNARADIFLHTLISLCNVALEGNCPHSQNLSLRGDRLRAHSEQEEEQSSYYVFKDSLAFVCPT